MTLTDGLRSLPPMDGRHRLRLICRKRIRVNPPTRVKVFEKSSYSFTHTCPIPAKMFFSSLLDFLQDSNPTDVFESCRGVYVYMLVCVWDVRACMLYVCVYVIYYKALRKTWGLSLFRFLLILSFSALSPPSVSLASPQTFNFLHSPFLRSWSIFSRLRARQGAESG